MKMGPFPYRFLCLLLQLGAVGVFASEVDTSIQFSPISISAQFDAGQIVKGKTSLTEKIQGGTSLDGEFLQRTGVWITQSAVVNEKLHFTMGVGGLFWFALPPRSGDPSTSLPQFGPGISQAQARYDFGDVDHPTASLQMGYFPYKYNPDAKNLGEYLLRSGTYPGYVVTGGWNMINSARYMVQGLRVNFPLWEGKFQSDFLLSMERDVPPMFDLSPSYVASLEVLPGLDLGAGMECNHCIAIKPSKDSPHFTQNQVITGVLPNPDSIIAEFKDPYIRDSTHFYTFQGVKLVGRFSLSPLVLSGMEPNSAFDFKLYAELAILGVKDYPFMYDNIFQRMPVMFGTDIPTYHILDVLSFEMEYYNSKYINNILNPLYNTAPLWILPYDPSASGSPAYFASQTRRDNWKWSLYAKKSVTKGIQLYAQVASDHMRTIMFNSGPQPSLVPVTNRNGRDWYYLIRLQFGI
jgi:hypothetical protein